MRSFIRKIGICLFEPRKMGFFFPEKIYKSVFQVLLMMLIIITPASLKLYFHTELDYSSTEYMKDYFMENIIDSDVVLKDNVLTGSSEYTFLLSEAIIYINPNNKEVDFDLAQYPTSHLIEFKNDRIEISFLNKVIYSEKYEEIEDLEIDFGKIANVDYLEFDKYIDLVNYSFSKIHTRWLLVNSVDTFLSIFSMTVITVFILAIISKIFNPIVKFRFRLKGALDAQFILLIFMMLMFLYNARFFKYIGLIFSAFYLIRALMAVVKIEVRKQPSKDGE